MKDETLIPLPNELLFQIQSEYGIEGDTISETVFKFLFDQIQLVKAKKK